MQVFQASLSGEKDKLEARFDLDNINIDKELYKDLESSIEQLREYEINATQIDFKNLHNEPLVKDHLENVAAQWLRLRFFRQADEQYDAINLARRISYQLYPQILRVVAEYENPYAPLASYLDKAENRELQKFREGAILYGAYLRGANLQNTNLRGADFGHANLGKTDFRGVVLSAETNFRNANLAGAKISQTQGDIGGCDKVLNAANKR